MSGVERERERERERESRVAKRIRFIFRNAATLSP